MKDIKDYEGIYAVTEDGRIYSYRRNIYLKPRKNNQGYLYVNLFKNKKGKSVLVHRLVAKAFVPNPDNKPQVNHKDENAFNNNKDNLEWCDNKYNSRYGSHAFHLKVYKNGMFIGAFNGTVEASEILGVSYESIRRWATGKGKSKQGYEVKIIERK